MEGTHAFIPLVYRQAQEEQYGQPQEAAMWDFLSLAYVQQAASEGSISEVMFPGSLYLQTIQDGATDIALRMLLKE